MVSLWLYYSRQQKKLHGMCDTDRHHLEIIQSPPKAHFQDSRYDLENIHALYLSLYSI